MASLLDLRWKNLLFVTQEEIRRVHKLLHEECELIKLQESLESENMSEEIEEDLNELISIQEDSDNCTIGSDFSNTSKEEQEGEEDDDSDDCIQDDHYEEENEEKEGEEEEKNEKEKEKEDEYKSIFENIQSYKDNDINAEISNFLARPPVLNID